MSSSLIPKFINAFQSMGQRLPYVGSLYQGASGATKALYNRASASASSLYKGACKVDEFMLNLKEKVNLDERVKDRLIPSNKERNFAKKALLAPFIFFGTLPINSSVSLATTYYEAATYPLDVFTLYKKVCKRDISSMNPLDFRIVHCFYGCFEAVGGALVDSAFLTYEALTNTEEEAAEVGEEFDEEESLEPTDEESFTDGSTLEEALTHESINGTQSEETEDWGIQGQVN